MYILEAGTRVLRWLRDGGTKQTRSGVLHLLIGEGFIVTKPGLAMTKGWVSQCDAGSALTKSTPSV